MSHFKVQKWPLRFQKCEYELYQQRQNTFLNILPNGKITQVKEKLTELLIPQSSFFQ